MVESHEFRGFWWLPEDEEEKLSGTLTVTKGDAELALLGHFGHRLLSDEGKERAYSFDLEERPRIHGISTAGKEITLERHGNANWSGHFPGIETSVYEPEVVLIGKLFAEDEEIGFDEIAIHASDLNTWTRVSGFETKIGGHEQAETGYFIATKTDIHFEAPDAIEIPLDNGEQARIEFRASSEGIGGGAERVSVAQTAALHLRFAKRAGLNEVFNRVGQLRNLLSLAVGRPVAILSVTGFQDDHRHPKSSVRVPIELLWRIPHNPEPPTRPRHPIDMFFTLPEATPSISEVMKNWFAKQAELKPVFNLFFGILYHPDMYLDVRFLTYAQAVETYDYRRRAANSKLTLDRRIRDVLDLCPEVSAKITGASDEERDAFVTTFKQSRNYYTHYNPKLEKKAATGAALFVLFKQLQAIIEMSLLWELGFSCEAIDAILNRVPRYAEIAHFKRLAAEESGT